MNVLFFVKWLKKVIQNEYSIYGVGFVWIDLFNFYIGVITMGNGGMSVAIGWRKRKKVKKCF